MIPETSLLTWPPLGEISVSDQSIETDLSTFVAVFNLVFVFFNQHGIFFSFREDLTMLRQEVQDLHASLKV